MQKPVLLLTGRPGVGKTTVVRRVADRLEGRPLGGFLTEEIREGGRRVGFRVRTFTGREAILAHVRIRSPHRVGRYRVDVEAFEGLIEDALDPGREAALHLVDEIGKMECLSPRFVKLVGELLDSGRPLVATVARRGPRFVAAVKERPGAKLVEVTEENRDRLPAEILTRARARP